MDIDIEELRKKDDRKFKRLVKKSLKVLGGKETAKGFAKLLRGMKGRRIMIESLIHKAAKAERELDRNFKADGKTYLVRCPSCEKENYAPWVSSGICAWCGYNTNEGGKDSGRK